MRPSASFFQWHDREGFMFLTPKKGALLRLTFRAEEFPAARCFLLQDKLAAKMAFRRFEEDFANDSNAGSARYLLPNCF
jgi:hypothetical protein